MNSEPVPGEQVQTADALKTNALNADFVSPVPTRTLPPALTNAHTPGPWWVTDYGVRDSGGFICATTHVQRYEGQEERFAQETAQREGDMRLIATAPELLSIARRWLALDGGAWHVQRHAAEQAELLADTRAALAACEAVSGARPTDGKTSAVDSLLVESHQRLAATLSDTLYALDEIVLAGMSYGEPGAPQEVIDRFHAGRAWFFISVAARAKQAARAALAAIPEELQ